LQIASGARIQRASDDASGLAISTHINAGKRSLDQALRNASGGISLVQTAEGGINDISNIVIRLRELSVQAASDTMGDQERSLSDLEFQHLKSEIDRIARTNSFSGRNLFSEQYDSVNVHVGAYSGEENSVSISAAGDLTTSGLGIHNANIQSKEDANWSIDSLDNALKEIGMARANFGALQTRMQSTINNLEEQSINASNAYSQIHDTDIALATTNQLRAQAMVQTSTAVLSQSNALGMKSLRLVD
jgi:flagellin